MQKRRNKLFQQLVDDASRICDRFAWATPSETALRVLAHFAPIVEVGCGAGYWAHCMRERATAVAAYDMFLALSCDGEKRALWTEVATGGPDMLSRKKHQGECVFGCLYHRVLVLCKCCT